MCIRDRARRALRFPPLHQRQNSGFATYIYDRVPGTRYSCNFCIAKSHCTDDPSIRLPYFCLSSSAGSFGTYLASQGSYLNNAFLYYLPASLYSFSLCFRRATFPQFFAFVGLFLYHVPACCRSSARTIVQYRKHSTAQRNQPARSRRTGTCRSECDNASKQTESIYCIAVPQAQHSTAQSARTKPQSKCVPFQSATMQ